MVVDPPTQFIKLNKWQWDHHEMQTINHKLWFFAQRFVAVNNVYCNSAGGVTISISN